ncbi:hypothetical protein [Streptomyces cyanogenus]|uniref:Uncharacterized protein n=1 Tax=Streptomyces cyanogenus TaxID=80860 RepID=A0ABX7TK36_STRCY|nr:hypothetical protein [Streptomyces cyanogenus]QTD96777.1 hypothetical protein S1361_05405 [Streptomyces cyanogenus]
MIAYAEAEDVQFRYTPEGYAGPDDSGIVMRGQPVGQVLRSRPLFMVTRDGANTEWDSMPSEEYRVDSALRHASPDSNSSTTRPLRADSGLFTGSELNR